LVIEARDKGVQQVKAKAEVEFEA